MMRGSGSDFAADSDFSVLLGEKGKPFVYVRGNAICVVNPSDERMSAALKEFAGKKAVYLIGTADVDGDRLEMGAGSFVILK